MAKSEIRNPKSQILIVGAGPAGAGAAIRLAQSGFAVTLIERDKFPRHKLCGEFISPECLEHFRALGVFERMTSAGGERISKTVFYEPGGRSVAMPSDWFGGEQAALSLSRAEMDFRLLERAREVGVRVLEETAVSGLLIENGAVNGVRARGAGGAEMELRANLTIDATGRARVLGKTAEREPELRNSKSRIPNPKSQIPNRLIGFKTHLKNADIARGICEIYFFPGGYGGLSRVEAGAANHCFLIRAEIVRKFGGDVEKILREAVFKNRRAFETMGEASPVREWLAVAVDGFGSKNLNPAPNLLAIGDAGAFIDPFTGSGMLMALESAEILAETINCSAPEQIAEIYRRRHRLKFQKRLRVCALLRRAAFAPGAARAAILALGASRRVRRALARATRAAAAVSKND